MSAAATRTSTFTPPGAAHSGAPPTSRRYGLNAGAVVYVVITVFLAVGAVNSQNNLLYIAFGVALSAMIVSGFISGSALVGIAVRRDPLAPGRAGEPVVFRYTIENRRRLPAFGLVIAERVSDEPKPVVTASVVMLPPRRAIRVTGRATFEARGIRLAEETLLTSTFPFGLLRKTVAVVRRDELLVGPRRARLRRGVLAVPRGGGRLTHTREPTASGSDEFVGLRDYLPGDSPRRIAWKPSARLGSLVVRQTSSATPPAILLLIEAAEPDEPWHFERAVVLAAAAAEWAASAGALVGLEIPAAGVSIAPTPDASAAGPLGRALAAASIGDHPGECPSPRVSQRSRAIRIGPGAAMNTHAFERLALLETASAPELVAPELDTPGGDTHAGGPRRRGRTGR